MEHQHALTLRQYCDLDLLLNGGFAPLSEFLGREDYESVRDTMRLANGSLWPIPVVLDIQAAEAAHYRLGDTLILRDADNVPLARMTISSLYQPDKTKEAHAVYGTDDRAHPGVKILFEEIEPWYAGGPVEALAPITFLEFGDNCRSPIALREFFARHAITRIIGFQTRNPIHRAHFELMKQAADRYQAHVLIHPVIGPTKEGDIDAFTRARCYQKVHQHYMKSFATLSFLPLAMRMAGPREAIWHALIRKNYGCTHFIVGRDHAGPGANAQGKPLYEPYAAQKLALRYADEIGIHIIPFQEMVYAEPERIFCAANALQTHQRAFTLSGTAFRAMLARNDSIPDWFSFPEVIEELRRGYQQHHKNGFTIFLTGLSGAGKSTIARLLYTELLGCQHRAITLLDGDAVRKHLSGGLGFTREDRDTNIKRIGFVASEVVRHGGIAICAAIAPYEEARQHMRARVSAHGAYIEVYVATPLEVCRARDVKGLYAKAAQGLLPHFTGIDDPYEIPRAPECTVDAAHISPREAVAQICTFLKQRGLLSK